MLDLSVVFDDIRELVLKRFRGVLHPWPVLHLVIPGPTQNENYNGIGPWARIWALPSPRAVKLPKGCAISHQSVSYVIAVYVPRVFTTDNLLETLLHEYLHIGAVEGEMNAHPPRQEAEFINRSASMARELLESSYMSQTTECITDSWADIRRRGVCGLTVAGLEGYMSNPFGNPIETEVLCLSELE